MSRVLVSVAIATYNSSKFIIDALESVKTQSYPNIELIVSDDCSKDNTVSIVKEWLQIDENYNRFLRVNVITVIENTGVSSNCNRIFKDAKGEFVKLLAGDDILLPNCIEDNLNFILNHPEVKVVFSQVGIFKDKYIPNQFEEIKPVSLPLNLMDPTFDANRQFNLLLKSDLITYTPSVFFDRMTIIDLGGFDEEIKMMEDYPMWLKLTSNGIKLYFFDRLTVGYRRHSSSLNNIVENYLFPSSILTFFMVRRKFVFPYLNWVNRGFEIHDQFCVRLILLLFKNDKKIKWIYFLIGRYLNPFWYLQFISKKLKSRNASN
jgi:alpha-1,3-rhamnosyltransferase